MADRGTVGAFARTGDSASNGANVRPAVPVGLLGGYRYGALGRSVGDGFPQPVNPILHRRGQVLTADPLLSSD